MACIDRDLQFVGLGVWWRFVAREASKREKGDGCMYPGTSLKCQVAVKSTHPRGDGMANLARPPRIRVYLLESGNLRHMETNLIS